MEYKQYRSKGLFFVITGAIFWGVGGTVAQKLFQEFPINVNWLVSTRLLIAGILLLTLQFLTKDRTQIFAVWKNKKTCIQLVIYGIFGMLSAQYTYMASIKHGNSAVATLLQYLAPVMIIIYMFLRKQSALTIRDLVIVALALLGCFFLLTNGSTSDLSVSTLAIFWGVLSGVSVAFYTLYAVSLLKQFDSLVIVGWAMIVGGISLSLIHAPWQIDFDILTTQAYIYLALIIVFGTMLAFWFYIESLQSLSPKETSILGSLEPLAAVITTVLWLKEPFGFYQWIGTACIIGVTFILANNTEVKKDNSLSF